MNSPSSQPLSAQHRGHGHQRPTWPVCRPRERGLEVVVLRHRSTLLLSSAGTRANTSASDGPVGRGRVALRFSACCDATRSPLHPAARDTLLAAPRRGLGRPATPAPRRVAGPASCSTSARESVAASLGVRPDEVVLPPQRCARPAAGRRRACAHARRRVGARVVTSAVDQAGPAPRGPRRATRTPRPPARRPARAASHPETLRGARSSADPGGGRRAPAGQRRGRHHPAARRPPCGMPCSRRPAARRRHRRPWAGWPPPTTCDVLVGDAATRGGPAARGARRPDRHPLRPARARAGSPSTVASRPTPGCPLALAAAEAWRQADARPAPPSRPRPAPSSTGSARPPPASPTSTSSGDPVDRLPHVVTFSALYVDGESLVDALDRRGIVVASGSACTSSRLEPSHVLAAMGALTHGNVRVTLPLEAVSPRPRRRRRRAVPRAARGRRRAPRTASGWSDL